MENKLQDGVKSWVTTVLGILIMSSQVFEYAWETYWKNLIWETQDYVQAGLIMVAGFALLFMKDQLTEWIKEKFKAR